MRNSIVKALLLASLLAPSLFHGGEASLAAVRGGATSDTIYVCPPCGHSCDRVERQEAGECPVCSMTLIDKGDLLTAAVFLDNQTMMAEAAPPSLALMAGRAFFTYTVSRTKEPVVSSEMFEIQAQYSVAEAPLPDVLIVPGGDWDIIEDQAAMAWLSKAGAHARGVLGIRRGVAVLAAAKLLDGHSAALDDATSRYLEFAQLKPEATFLRDQKVVESGKVFTAADRDSALDASLLLLRKLLGEGPARQVADRLQRPFPDARK